MHKQLEVTTTKYILFITSPHQILSKIAILRALCIPIYVTPCECSSRRLLSQPRVSWTSLVPWRPQHKVLIRFNYYKYSSFVATNLDPLIMRGIFYWNNWMWSVESFKFICEFMDCSLSIELKLIVMRVI